MRAVLPGCYPCAAPARPHAPCHLAAHAAPPSHPPRTVPRCYTAYGPRRRDDQHCGAHSHDHLSPITQCRRTHPAPGAATATSTAWTAEAGPATSTARHRTQSHEHDAACHTCTNRSPVTRRQHNEGGVLGLHDEQRLGQGMDAATRRHEPYAHHMHYSLPPTKHSAIDPTNIKAIPATQHRGPLHLHRPHARSVPVAAPARTQPPTAPLPTAEPYAHHPELARHGERQTQDAAPHEGREDDTQH